MVLQKRQYSRSNIASSVCYHDIFDYPLTKEDLARWIPSKKAFPIKNSPILTFYKNHYCLENREHLIAKRAKREAWAKGKMQIAKRGANLLKIIPTIQMIGITGSLAMNNCKKGSDIDFLIITKAGSVWTTRILAYALLKFFNVNVRKAGEKSEQDKLCLNMWMDESDLYFDKQNIFTAHEVAQIVPLVNKNKIFERLIGVNKWIFEFWPRAVEHKRVGQRREEKSILSLLDPIAYWIQMMYMEGKRSREVVTPTRAFFHPFDWGEKVMEELKKRGIPPSKTLPS